MDYVRTIYNNYKYKKTKVGKKAAFIFYQIASKHPFADGNKRTAIITCNSFLEYNGYTIGTLPYRKSYNFILAVAQGKKSENECYDFIRKHLAKLSFSKGFHDEIKKLMSDLSEKYKN